MDNSNPVLTGGLLCAGVILFLLIMTPVIVALELRRLRRARARFLEGRQVLSDAAFLSRAAVAVDRGAFLEIVSFSEAKAGVSSPICDLLNATN